MFTGIVEETGRVVSFAQNAKAWRFQIAATHVREGVAIGDSIAINGCCLTVVAVDEAHLYFDVLEETRRLTNFSALTPGALVNLERSLRFDGKVGGHFVTGHIDGLGTVDEVTDDTQMRAAGALVPFADGKGLTVASPFHLDGETQVAAQRAPSLGQHSETVLREAGYSRDEIASLRARGVLA